MADFAPDATFSIERLQAALDAAGIGVWEMTLPERRLNWSARCKQLFGFAPNQALTFEQVVAAVHPQDRPLLHAALARASAPEGEGRYENEYRVLEPGYHGQERWIRSVGSVRFDKARNPVMLQGFCLDITESKRTSAAAQKHLQEFEFLSETIPDILWMADSEGAITYFNKRWTEYTGQSLAEAQEWGWGPAIHPDDLASCQIQWNRSLQSGKPYEATFRLRAQEGNYRWLIGRALPLHEADGHILKWFGTCTDIHEQRMLQEQLHERETQFRSIANSIPQLAWMTEPSGHILWYNQRWYEYTGTTLAQMRNEQGWRQVHHSDHFERVFTRWTHSLQTGEPWSDVFPLRRHDGGFRWFLGQAVPIRNEAGDITRWFGTNTDITELQELPAKQQVRSFEDETQA
jgi:PAS domain S-box-containing protein